MTQRFGPNTPDRVLTIERVPTYQPLSPMQFLVAVLVGVGWSYRQVAKELKIEVSTVRMHLNVAASRIPGDLPAKARVVAWVRGASLDVLEGRALSHEMLRLSRGRSPHLAVAEAAAGV